MVRGFDLLALGLTWHEIDMQTANDRNRMVARLRDAGLTLKQIAGTMGVAPGTVRAMEMRARDAQVSALSRATATLAPMERGVARRLLRNLRGCRITVSW